MTWTWAEGGDHEGKDWIIHPNDAPDGSGPYNGYINGTHYNIRTFMIPAGLSLLQYGMGANDSMFRKGTKLEIIAENIVINGELAGYNSGYWGGTFPNDNGDGLGGGEYDDYGGGGGYAAVGGPSGTPLDTSNGGDANGTASGFDIDFGSGGGCGGSGNGGGGGGCISLRAEQIYVYGTVSCNGAAAPASTYRGGGGSGGGIRIVCNKLYVMPGGVIMANGALGEPGGTYGYGSGGRIKIFYHTSYTNNGTVSAVNGKGVDSGGIYTDVIGNCRGTVSAGYFFRVQSDMPVCLTAVILNVRTVTEAGYFRIRIYDGVYRAILLGSGTIYVDHAGENTWYIVDTSGNPLQLEGNTDYYMEIMRTSSTVGNITLSVHGVEYGTTCIVRAGEDIAGVEPYIKLYGYGHVSNAGLYNIDEPNIIEYIASCMPVGATATINADGTGTFRYEDDFTTDKYLADAICENTHKYYSGRVSFNTAGGLTYKIMTLYPVIGSPVLTALIYKTDGNVTVEVAYDVDGSEPDIFYEIDTPVVSGTTAEYVLKSTAGNISFDGETIIWFRIYADGISTGEVRSIIVDAVLNTQNAQTMRLNAGTNTVCLLQDNDIFAGADVTLSYRNRKLG